MPRHVFQHKNYKNYAIKKKKNSGLFNLVLFFQEIINKRFYRINLQVLFP